MNKEIETNLNTIQLIADTVITSRVKRIEDLLSNLINHYEHERTEVISDSSKYSLGSIYSLVDTINDICSKLTIDIKQIIDCNNYLKNMCESKCIMERKYNGLAYSSNNQYVSTPQQFNYNANTEELNILQRLKRLEALTFEIRKDGFKQGDSIEHIKEIIGANEQETT